MTFGSLFAGIGGFDLGFERAGMTCKWQVEIDPYCRRVLAKHWPDVRRHDDVRTFPPTDGTEWRVDVICGGFPCQDISVAGKGVGIDGARSGLWAEYARIVRTIRPRFVVVENSPALTGRGLYRVLGDLAACGYDAEWDCIPAAAVGAPHRRDRLFIIAYSNSQRRQEQHAPGIAAIPGLDSRSRHAGSDTESIGCGTWRAGRTAGTGSREKNAAEVANTTSNRLERFFWTQHEGNGIRSANSGWWSSEPGMGRVAHGVSNRMDRIKGLGNAVVPQVAEWIGRRLMESVK